MYRTFLIPTIMVCLSLLSCQNQIPDPPANPENPIETVLWEATSPKGLPGIIAAISDTSGIRFIESAGVRKAGSSVAMTTGDQVHLGSCTKAMTSTLLATLVEDGLLSWDTTLIGIFPELRDSLHADYHDLRLHELVTHRAGLPANAKNWRAYEELDIKERRVALIRDNLAEAHSAERGEYLYSNLGYLVAGAMAEKVTGKSWEVLMRERLFNPLDMESAGFGPPGTKGEVDQPWGHLRFLWKWRPLQTDNAEALGPAGTVHCTLEDWAKFAALQLPQDNNQLLPQEQLDFLVQPLGEYAAGWVIAERSWANGPTYSHNGSNTMWSAVIWVAPELGRAYLAAANGHNKKSMQILDEVITELIKYDQE